MSRKLTLTLGLMVVAGTGASALADGPVAQSGKSDDARIEEIIVTGTRATSHTALTSAVQIDVISGEKLVNTGYADLARALSITEPSLNFPHPQTTPSSANTRPITLRGLAPDEVLVLVDGKRWHTSAEINTNFAVGRGSAPFDLSTIPLSAIDHIEVLRDGAAAQYGSDAIAGVVNIILKSNNSGGFVDANVGLTGRGDGANGGAAFNIGYALGQDGHLTVSGEFQDQQATNRAGVDQRYGMVDFKIGDPASLGGDIAVSAAYPIPNLDSEIYDDLLLSRKNSSNFEIFPAPGTTPLYPNGYLPEVDALVVDAGNTFGVRGRLPDEIGFDLSNTFGYSNVAFNVKDTLNAALGLASPTSFYAGQVTYLQDVTDLNLTRALPDLMYGANLAAGGEYRYEYYDIGNGDPLSYYQAGSVGFPGFNPRIPVGNSRDAEAVYLDGELKPLRWLSVNAAGRYDHYSDFGGDTTWKTSARAEATDWLAFRALASTGFRAPSLQQEYYSSITSTTNGVNKSVVNVGTYQVRDPVAAALGATPLRPENSRDESVGFVLTPQKALSLTADFFRTDITHRIELSDALSGAAVTAALAGQGITNVQQVAFFTNAMNTRTQGYDLAVHYTGRIDDETNYNISIAYERSPTKILSLATNPVLPTLPLNGLHSQLLLTEAQPRDKLTSQFVLNHDIYTGMVTATRYGEYIDVPILSPQKFSAKTIVDLSAEAHLGEQASLTLGILNVGNVYPDPLQQVALAYKTYGGSYVYGEESPWGVSGRAYFIRLHYGF